MLTIDVASGKPQMPELVERTVERRVQPEVAERDPGRDPWRLQAEEGAIQQQHEAVEREAERERSESRRGRRGLSRSEVSALVDDAHDRVSKHGGEDTCGYQQECDLSDAGRDHVAEAVQVGPRGEPRKRRKEHGCNRDREDPLREHVETERRVDCTRRVEPVDQSRGEECIDDGVEVDQSETDRDRDHQGERLTNRWVAPVDDDVQPAVASAQPRNRQQKLKHRRDQDRERVDVQFVLDPVRTRDPMSRPAMMATFQRTGLSAGTVKWS